MASERSIQPERATPHTTSPNSATSTPPTISRARPLADPAVTLEMPPAPSPSATNTVVKPATYRSDPASSRARKLRRRDVSARSAALAPLTQARYAGSSGTVHGAKNEASPAANVAATVAIDSISRK